MGTILRKRLHLGYRQETLERLAAEDPAGIGGHSRMGRYVMVATRVSQSKPLKHVVELELRALAGTDVYNPHQQRINNIQNLLKNEALLNLAQENRESWKSKHDEDRKVAISMRRESMPARVEALHQLLLELYKARRLWYIYNTDIGVYTPFPLPVRRRSFPSPPF